MTTLHQIFPTAVAEFDLSNESAAKNAKQLIDDAEAVKVIEHGLVQNGFSSYGSNMSILNQPGFESLKALMLDCVQDYSYQLSLGKLEISNSWYNKFSHGGKIQQHRHEGSVCSAAFYPYSEEGSANLRFHSPLKPYRMNEIFGDENYLNTYFWEFPAKTNTLYIFPSWLEHETNVNESNERYVISFNTTRWG
tara:strand:+ start:1908 stop:2486 length:579 start_codon:yes stop_codon:yes gene_type:complete